MLEWLTGVLFPSRCVGCQRHGDLLCAACRRELPLLGAVCSRCALPRGQTRACRGCPRLAPTLRSLRAVCAYDGAARSAVHGLKFRGGRGLAPLLGRLMRTHLLHSPVLADLVVPVPIAPLRRRERGYNQAELLAEQVLPAVRGASGSASLARVDRPAQQGLNALERATNLRGAIRVTADVRGKRVLLIDDVATTGATLSACADALAAAGAREVRALVFARDL